MLALLFPGQGSQEVGMGRDVYDASAAARAVFDLADETLGLPVRQLCFEGPEEELRRTEVQQPAILATSIALLRALAERVTLEPAFVAGHSLGEYGALVCAGSLDLEDALRLVHLRGRLMQEAVAEGKGAMAAILGCGPDVVDRACERARAETGRVVTPANYNGPAQTVIAGDALAVEYACARAKEAGAKRAVALPVSAPFHCPLMQPAAEKLWPELVGTRFRAPHPPVVTNVEAQPNTDPGRIPELLRAQVTAPVRFTEMVRHLAGAGVTRVLEVGPGRVLSGLVARIEPRLERLAVGSVDDLARAADALSSH
ncbi:MAG TPA: ACP S-malonyltransferase [Myxococcota bacterium]|nr:ACP S-malonyltransferase [Myxococcota bacterium]